MKIKCDICKVEDAKYDAKHITYGCWGYMCPKCYQTYGSKIKGLYTVLKDDKD